jgi:hypothetical protein
MDFTKVNKKDFKCLKQTDGSVYYGQLVWVVPATTRSPSAAGELPPTTETRPASQAEAVGRMSVARSQRCTSMQKEHEWTVVNQDEIEELTEDKKETLKQMRHGHGVQIYPDGVAKYAGTWHFD